MSALDSLLRHAIACVPRYRGLPPSLANFPVVDKRLILSDLAAHITCELGGGKAGLIRLLRDEQRVSEFEGECMYGARLVIEETSGSSGIPFRIPKSVEERAALAYGIWKYRRCYDRYYSPQKFYPFIHRSKDLPWMGNPKDFKPESLDKLYRNLSTHGIRWVHGDPGLLYRHASAISGAVAEDKSVCFAESSSQTLRPRARCFIERKLKVKIVDQYGCRETWVIGTRRDSSSFTVLTDNVIVELLDTDGHPIIQPCVEGRIVVTSLHQRVFPFIRYDVGDIGMWASEPAGKTLQLSTYRQYNVFQGRNENKDGHKFFKNILLSAYKRVGHVRLEYIQIRQIKPDLFVMATSKSAKARKLCETVNAICRAHPDFSRDVRFDHKAIVGQELVACLGNKAALYTTKHMEGRDD